MGKRYIYIACGGSGGHIFPGLGVCSILAESKKVNIILAGIRRKENIIFFRNYIKNKKFKNVEYFFLPNIKINDIFPKKTYFAALNLIVYMVKLFYAIIVVYINFFDKKPSLVFGFGSYAAFPVVFAAAFLKNCFTVIHEQNVQFGKANKVLIPWVDKITLNFPCSSNHLKTINKKFKFYNRIGSLISRKSQKGKFKVIGNPVLAKNSFDRKNINKVLLDKDIINILVTGGSQGSDFINEVVPESLSLLNEEVKNKINVVHIAGRGKKNMVSERYKKLTIKSTVLDVSFCMDRLYKKSDLIISRAGAGTLSEIIFYQLPSILLPFKFVGGHQIHNAMFLKDLKAAIVLDEKECNNKKLSNNIQDLVENDFLRKNILENLRKIPYINSHKEILKITRQAEIY